MKITRKLAAVAVALGFAAACTPAAVSPSPTPSPTVSATSVIAGEKSLATHAEAAEKALEGYRANAPRAPRVVAPGTQGTGQKYFVNCSGGSDSNNGTSTSTPWATTSKVNSTNFAAGSTIYLAQGCTFNGNFGLNGTGTASQPIILYGQGYGTGANADIHSPDSGYNAVQLSGAYQKIIDVTVENAYNAGIGFSQDHDSALYDEVYNSGGGIEADGDSNGNGATNSVMEHNNVHDVRMVVNDPGGDNDYGATGYTAGASGATVAYNTCTNCIAPSDDYGVDGGFLEVYGVADNLSIHNNFSNTVDGFVEMGAPSSSGGHSNNDNFYDNVLVNTTVAIHVNVNDAYGTSAAALHWDQNTFVQTTSPQFNVMYGTDQSTSIRNSIFALYPSGENIGSTPQTHTGNLWSSSPGYTLGTNEVVGSPAFVGARTGCALSAAYHLQSTSKAIISGEASLGYAGDYNGHAFASTPSAGAFQYDASESVGACS